MRGALADGGAVPAERLVTWRRPVPAHTTGRTCSEAGCETVLSIYNATDRCALHRTFVTIVPRNPGSGSQEAD